MNKIYKVISTTALLMLALSNAQAAPLNYTITGEVVLGGTNTFGLMAGDLIYATGTFDDSALTGDAGQVFFDAVTSNTMTISVGNETYTAADDAGSPSITFTSLTSISDFDFFAADLSFNSSFTSFDDFDNMFGDWAIVEVKTVVPVPAAVWLFGSGLLGLAGLARRKAA